jgi:Glutamine synthetase, catalytic domain
VGDPAHHGDCRHRISAPTAAWARARIADAPAGERGYLLEGGQPAAGRAGAAAVPSSVRRGTGIETVIVAAPDMQGRLFGRRMSASIFRTKLDGIDICTCTLAWDIEQDLGLQVDFAGFQTGWPDFRIERHVVPGPPVTGNAYEHDRSPLPADLRDAAARLRASAAAPRFFGDAAVEHYAAVAEFEWQQFMAVVTE